jgi:hypothetical protein
MPNPSSSRPGRRRGSKRGQRQVTKHDPDARAAILRESLSPKAVGISPDVQKLLILELLEATQPPKHEKRPPMT